MKITYTLWDKNNYSAKKPQQVVSRGNAILKTDI